MMRVSKLRNDSIVCLPEDNTSLVPILPHEMYLMQLFQLLI